MQTLEIGSGYSTVVFLNEQCFHTCITPVQEEVDRIRDYCENTGISAEGSEFIVDRSFRVLPVISRKDYDLIFIDGAHSFPYPMVDWFYSALILKQGGLIVIDDTDIISCHVLLRFMLNDPNWEEVEVRENFALFRKIGGIEYPFDWPSQPFSAHRIEDSRDLLDAFYPEVHSMQDSLARGGEGIVLKEIGPTRVRSGEGFNRQPDGASAIWAHVENATKRTVIMWGGTPLATAFKSREFLTALVPDELYLKPGEFQICLMDMKRGVKSNGMVLTVES